MTALSSADPGRPIDWRMPSRSQAWRTRPAGLAALVRVHDDAGHLAAAHRRCHGQRAVGQRRVVVLAERMPEHSAGGHVHHRGHSVECSFVAVHRICVTWESSQVRTAFGRQGLPRSDST
jgi:hypothetical protein